MTVLELRVALTTEQFDRLVAFYGDGLGLDPGELWQDGGRGQMFAAGRGTLEIFEPGYAETVDRIEVGERVSGPVRFAFEVPDLDAALAQALDFGAELVHEPVVTPWGDRNARVRAPDGLQVTLYEVGGSIG